MGVGGGLVVASAIAAPGGAQQQQARSKAAAKDSAKAVKDSVREAKAAKAAGVADGGTAREAALFQAAEPLSLTLTINVKRIKGDRGDNPPWRSATLSYAGADGAATTVPVRARTRGIWRLKNCEMPPIRLNFSNKEAKHTVFQDLDRPKLVNYCRNDDLYEQYILQEFQLYRIYHLLTPASHAVRLVRMAYTDSASGKVEATRYAFIEEDPDVLAARMNGRMLKIKGGGPDDFDPYQTALFGVFQYMIGNTDFALSALHNVELLGLNSGDYWPVAYDFDFSGAVNARYAVTDYRLPIRNVRDRLYRGFCVPKELYPKVFALFDAKKDSIYALYRDPLGKLLRPKTVDETLRYFDEFYKTIDDPSLAKDDIINACLGRR
jgi:hypothetical protein